MSIKETDTIVVTIETPDTVVDEVAEELEEIDAEPSREEIRQRVYDRVEVRAEFVDEERHPVVDRVANAVA